MPGSTPSLSKFSQQEISKLFSTAKRCVRSKGLDILLAPSLLRQGFEGQALLGQSDSASSYVETLSPLGPTSLSNELPPSPRLRRTGRRTGRILVVTPRRIGNAPERNKIRRQLKALYYELKLAERGYDCVVIIKPEGKKLAFEAIKQLLIQAFENTPATTQDPA
ncbi:MAG: ribonuclease P protein component [Candidatus Dependentiae bacterium]|nr:ribonuclease P protein component [Candidatus Dependentiae bacterium]